MDNSAFKRYYYDLLDSKSYTIVVANHIYIKVHRSIEVGHYLLFMFSPTKISLTE